MISTRRCLFHHSKNLFIKFCSMRIKFLIFLHENHYLQLIGMIFKQMIELLFIIFIILRRYTWRNMQFVEGFKKLSSRMVFYFSKKENVTNFTEAQLQSSELNFKRLYNKLAISKLFSVSALRFSKCLERYAFVYNLLDLKIVL